jgi:hypothetical protein
MTEESIILNSLGIVIVAALIMMIWFLRSSPLKRGSAIESEKLSE